MKPFILGLSAFALGAAITIFVFINPLGWQWAGLARTALPATASSQADGASATAPAARPITTRKVLYWRAPMDPSYISDKPGKSPMGMDLVPVYEDEAGGTPGVVKIDPAFVQNMGVQSVPVQRTDIPFTIRTVGTLTYNDRQVAWVNTKYDGWIEKVYVNYVGQPVHRGEKLFDIYSPQLVTTEQEYLQAIHYARQMEETPYPDMAARARALVTSARQRLRFWDMSDAQIDALATSGQVQRTVPVLAPVTGIVVQKADQALQGMYVKAGMPLYKTVDLSTIWVDADIFENQIPWMRLGQRASVTLPSEPGRTYTGRVRFIYPYLDPKTRTMRVSIEMPNPGGRLRADMYANVTFDVPAARHVLAVPENAVIQSGTRNVVVIDCGHGLFQARTVTLGLNGRGLWQVLDGVQEGERVVTSAQFLIDSESNLKAAIQQMTPAQASTPPAAVPPAPAPAAVPVPDAGVASHQ
ncbi:MAG: efflux RND transporter periplasmic adaptor subunit [Acidobacteriota bacterium]|nr:efflux RND transporter periplasmic adaptor subunit [Acidobacteriota bacterium]